MAILTLLKSLNTVFSHHGIWTFMELKYKKDRESTKCQPELDQWVTRFVVGYSFLELQNLSLSHTHTHTHTLSLSLSLSVAISGVENS
jgi:hypothetical protein